MDGSALLGTGSSLSYLAYPIRGAVYRPFRMFESDVACVTVLL